VTNNPFHLYTGDGTTIASRGLRLPELQRAETLEDPRFYLAEKPLRDAVNVAITLGMPLLLTGEPGTGKTQLAASVAWELGLPEPLVFHTKTTSVAKDLFYRYDALRHFHDSHFRPEAANVDQYISYEALGLAILLSLPPATADGHLPSSLQGKGPTRSVVLIDEIDKAPRDLPNDVLDEMENFAFSVPETGRSFSAGKGLRPILIMTSNSEKNLPDAFLRRCVFYHISFPDRERLREIIQRRLPHATNLQPKRMDQVIAHFERIRGLALRKKPATAELLQWIEVLERLRIDPANLDAAQADALRLSYCVLAKSQEDLSLMQGMSVER
jgi:MoxR-like ATPase